MKLMKGREAEWEECRAGLEDGMSKDFKTIVTEASWSERAEILSHLADAFEVESRGLFERDTMSHHDPFEAGIEYSAMQSCMAQLWEIEQEAKELAAKEKL